MTPEAALTIPTWVTICLGDARGLALLGSRGSSARSPGDDRLSAQDALQPGALARSEGVSVGSQPIAPRPGDRSRPVGSRLPLDYALKTGANFLTVGALDAATARCDHGASPELRSPAAVGRPPVVTGAGLQPLRRSGRRSRVGRPRPACMGARGARHGVRGPLRAFSWPSRYRVSQ